jgi:hypothetical protein
MADLTSRIAKCGIDEPSQLDVEARVAARSSEGVIGMALLAVCEVGLGCLAVVVRISPSGRVSHLAVTEGAVEAARLASVVRRDDRGSQV